MTSQKKEAEKFVWQETAGKPYTVSCINPSMVWGPCLAKAHTKASPYVFRQALLGNKQPNRPYSVVDVRNVAAAHVEALVRPEANQKRFILDGGAPMIAVNDILEKCRQKFPQFLFQDAPGKKGWDDNWGGKQPTQPSLDNTRSKTVLGINYIPTDQTIYDSVEAIVKKGFVPAKPSSKL